MSTIKDEEELYENLKNLSITYMYSTPCVLHLIDYTVYNTQDGQQNEITLSKPSFNRSFGFMKM